MILSKQGWLTLSSLHGTTKVTIKIGCVFLCYRNETKQNGNSWISIKTPTNHAHSYRTGLYLQPALAAAFPAVECTSSVHVDLITIPTHSPLVLHRSPSPPPNSQPSIAQTPDNRLRSGERREWLRSCSWASDPQWLSGLFPLRLPPLIRVWLNELFSTWQHRHYQHYEVGRMAHAVLYEGS